MFSYSLPALLLVFGAEGCWHLSFSQSDLGKPAQQGYSDKRHSKKGNVEMVPIPAGWSVMGDDDQGNNQRHRVYLDAYLIGKTPVTVGQFKEYCLEQHIDFSKFPVPTWGWIDDHPMVNVTWQEAREFCLWAGGYLPTEAQWEKAARGTDGRKYPWGNDWDTAKLQWSPGHGGSAKMTASVDAHPGGASPFGCLDMAGNVWQWVSDWYWYIDTSHAEQNPIEPSTNRSRSLRGGSWEVYIPGYFRSSFSYTYGMTPLNQIGFRLAGPP